MRRAAIPGVKNQTPEFESQPKIIIPDLVIFPHLVHLRQFVALYKPLFPSTIKVFRALKTIWIWGSCTKLCIYQG